MLKRSFMLKRRFVTKTTIIIVIIILFVRIFTAQTPFKDVKVIC